MSERRIPELPSLRAVTRQLRELHEAWAHPEAGGDYVRLVCVRSGDAPYYAWEVHAAAMIDDLAVAQRDEGGALVFGWELVPSDGARFDAVRAARRLLAAARDAGVG